MTVPTPASPEEALAAARALLAEQAQTVTGTPSAGIYGDTAGREQPPQPIDLSAAQRTEVDADALMAMLQKQQQQIDALLAEREADRIANLPPEPEPPDIVPHLGNASGEMQAAFHGLHVRVKRLEDNLGIDAAKALAELLANL